MYLHTDTPASGTPTCYQFGSWPISTQTLTTYLEDSRFLVCGILTGVCVSVCEAGLERLLELKLSDRKWCHAEQTGCNSVDWNNLFTCCSLVEQRNVTPVCLQQTQLPLQTKQTGSTDPHEWKLTFQNFSLFVGYHCLDLLVLTAVICLLVNNTEMSVSMKAGVFRTWTKDETRNFG